MTKFVRSAVILLVAAGAGLMACDGGGDGDPTGTDPTQIRVTVRADGDPESGVTVRLFAPGGTASLEEETTNASGQVTFTDLDPDLYDDTYEVEVAVPTGLEMETGEARRGVTVTAGQTTSVTFDLITPLPDNLRVVTLQGSSFSPSAVTIDAGMTIRWVNGGPVTHTITPDGHSEWTSQTVTSDGQTFEHTFDSVGSYEYLCQFHAGMTGTITVN